MKSKSIDRVIKSIFSEKGGAAGRKNATGEAKRVRMDGGCITPNHATDMATSRE